jgi:RsiW-degrading membrane proteinase PrsW (M82 family)
LLVLLSLAVAPAVFLLLFVYLRDKYEREPLSLVAITFVIGAACLVPAALIEFILGIFLPSNFLLQVFLSVALVEELTKFIAVRIKAYSSPHFREVMDGIVCTVAAGLGFATLENVVYILQSGLSVAITRAFLSVPGHAVWAGIMGFYIGLAKFNARSKSQERLRVIEGVGIATIFHGVYDLLVFSESLLGVIAISVVGWILFLLLIRRALSMSPFRWRETQPKYPVGGLLIPSRPRFCTRCGSRLVGDENFCINCGLALSNRTN